jgi:hypothetical protein
MSRWFAWLFLESLPALAVVLGTTLFVLLVYWRRTGRGRPLLVGLGVSVLLLVVQTLVVTPREHALRIMAGIERDLVAQRTDTLERTLAGDFEFASGRAGFLDLVRARMEQIQVRYLRHLWLTQVDADQREAVVKIAYQADVTGHYSGSVFSTWQLRFVNTPEGWRIHAIKCVNIGDLDSPDWELIREL